MAIREHPIDPSWQQNFKTVQDVRPVLVRTDDGPTGEQQRDRDTDLPLWEISVTVKLAGDRRVETIHVKVPAVKEPDVDGKRPVFGNLRVGKYAMAGFRSGEINSDWTYRADTVADATAPSARNQPPTPPADTKAA